MCKRNSPDKNEASTGCVRETPQIKRERETKNKKQNKTKTKKVSTGYVRETPQIKKEKEVITGCVRETPPIKINPAWDV